MRDIQLDDFRHYTEIYNTGYTSLSGVEHEGLKHGQTVRLVYNNTTFIDEYNDVKNVYHIVCKVVSFSRAAVTNHLLVTFTTIFDLIDCDRRAAVAATRSIYGS